jgi:hypothetical protein
MVVSAADCGAAQIHERAARAHVELARWWRATGASQLARRELSRATIRRRAADIERDLDFEAEREVA